MPNDTPLGDVWLGDVLFGDVPCLGDRRAFSPAGAAKAADPKASMTETAINPRK